MTVTLCIETSGSHCSLAVATSEKIYHCDRILKRSHNQHLLELLDDLFRQAHVRPTQVGVVGMGCGPGSFTGVRIAASAVQAIAVAAHAKVVPLASSWVLAASAFQESPQLERVVTCIRSRGDAYYLAAYTRQQTQPELDETCATVFSDVLVESLPTWVEAFVAADPSEFAIVGEPPPWLPQALGSAVVDGVAPRASAMVPRVAHMHARGESVEPEYALPTYVAGDSPWRKQ